MTKKFIFYKLTSDAFLKFFTEQFRLNIKSFLGLVAGIMTGIFVATLSALIIFYLADSSYGVSFGYFGIILFPFFTALTVLIFGKIYLRTILKEENQRIKNIFSALSLWIPVFIMFLSFPFLIDFIKVLIG